MSSRRVSILASLALTLPLALVSPRAHSVSPAIGDSLPGLTSAQVQAFNEGKDSFAEEETVADGLGPVFNDVSCGTCHSAPVLGGGSNRLVTRFGTTTNGVFDPLAQFGGSLIQENGIGPQGSCTFVAEVVPPEATIVAHRRTTPLFGLGLVDAVPDAVFVQIAALEKLLSPGTAGKVNMVPNLVTSHDAVGKFGWKCQNPTLFQFSGDAYLNEMGITSIFFPNENCPGGDCTLLSCNPDPGINDQHDDVQKFADFMTFMAPPARGPITDQVRSGEVLFYTSGCFNCHLSVLQTGRNPVAALNRVTFNPYSDFLLHDMGSLGDGIQQSHATGHDIRTAPLWGLRYQTRYLHDARATTIEEAILAHDGQAKHARDHFAALSSSRKQLLIAFLKSL